LRTLQENQKGILNNSAMQNYDTIRTRRYSKKEERDLIIQAQQGDLEAQDLLVYASWGNLKKLASTLLTNFKFSEDEFSDILSRAVEGYIDGIKKFDLTTNYRLSTFAMWRARSVAHCYCNSLTLRLKPLKQAYMDVQDDLHENLDIMNTIEDPNPDEPVIQWEEDYKQYVMNRVSEWLNTLEPVEKESFLQYYKKESMGKIAESMGIAVPLLM
jgi:RNA polymerase sigma factor (sigma-70 family)